MNNKELEIIEKCHQELITRGFTIIEDFISKQITSQYLKLIKEFWVTEQVENPKFCKRFPQLIVNNLPIKTRDFDHLFTHPVLMNILKKLLGSRFILGESRACNVEKCTEVPFIHQDGHVRTFADSPLSLVTIFLLEDFKEENGGTLLYPGSHNYDFSPKEVSPSLFSNSVLEAPAGTIAIFNSNVWHGPGINQTGESRWSINSYYSRWFVKPFFDMAARFSKKEYLELDSEMKQLLGFTSTPPVDETKSISTLITEEEALTLYPFKS